MRAVGYYRSLPEDRAPPAGEPWTEDPEYAIDRYCREESHRLVRIIVDERARTGDGDDGFRALLAFLRETRPRVRIAVIPDATHLADDLVSLARRLLALESADADVKCAEPDLPDPLQSGLEHLAMPGRSPERIQRIRQSVLAKAARGEVLGRTPYGYAGGVDGLLHPHPEESSVVARVFDWYTGRRQPPGGADRAPAAGIGLRRIADALNGEGSRTRRGNLWTPATLAGMLRNRVYVGAYSRYGFRLARAHEPIVDRDVFRRAQELMRARAPLHRRSRGIPFLLRGIARCAVCGRGLRGATRTRVWRRRDGTRVARTYRYYECPLRARRTVDERGPDHPAWRAERLEAVARRGVGEWFERRAGPAAAALARATPDPLRAVAEAERRFMRALRQVASGHGGLGALQTSLATLDAARASASDRQTAATPLAEVVAEATSASGAAARDAFSLLLDRVVVSVHHAELLFSVASGD